MKNKLQPFASRIDSRAVHALMRRSLPRPLDALNLVTFANEISYRWYGLLLAPLVFPLGGRPVWVGVHNNSLYGNKNADEIVIIRYPDHQTLLSIMTSRYYSLVNRIREKGVRYFEFSLTAQVAGESKIKYKGKSLVVHFNSDSSNALNDIKSILEKRATRLIYASRQTSELPIFKHLEASDPNPAQYTQTAIFAINDMRLIERFLDSGTLEALRTACDDLSVQVYRPLHNSEAMPWAKRTTR